MGLCKLCEVCPTTRTLAVCSSCREDISRAKRLPLHIKNTSLLKPLGRNKNKLLFQDLSTHLFRPRYLVITLFKSKVYFSKKQAIEKLKEGVE